jgi:hypothetical protein
VVLIIANLFRLAIVPGGRANHDYLTSEIAATWSSVALNGITLLGLALLMVGFVGLYVAQLEAAGTLGLVGFLVLFFGLALNISREWFELFVLPDAALAVPDWVDTDNTGWIRFGSRCRACCLGWAGSCSRRPRSGPGSTHQRPQ